MKRTLIIGTVTFLVASAFTVLKMITWKTTADYSVKCKELDGVFKGLKASIAFDEDEPGRSFISATIDARTFDTGNGLKNSHAKDKNGLYADKYPWITFVSTSVKKIAVGKYETTGNLTLRGITKEVKIPFRFDSKKNSVNQFPMVAKETFYGVLTITPKDFNVTRMGVPDQLFVELNIPVTQ